jgi:gamma-polyglutamate biosynthesis protein CapC
MIHFALHIFPESSLASSLITTVWVGVFVTCFFNLRYGWNKSGLIIPGYLVPLLILKPWSAVAVLIEGLVTFLIVKFISEFGSFTKMWCNYFGRDRFFLIFLVAIGVRILFDQILFPEATNILSHYFNIDFVYKGGLYSIGLVIVALIANHFWNSGLKRGFPHLLIILICTYLIIVYILIPHTNFRLNNIVYLYEDIATSIAASPKAYIILTVTAFIASRMNLLYGWEFSGIIIPALLALQWYYPWKIATSILEAGIIYGFATITLKSRFFQNATIEGARKILLFFNIAFIYKIILGFIMPIVYTNAPVTDTFGLGYMLTSLIAIKMYDKKIGLKMTRTILQASIVSIIFATLIGFILLYLPNPFSSDKKIIALNTTHQAKIYHTENKSLTTILSSQQVKLYGRNAVTGTIKSKDLKNFARGIIALRYYSKSHSHSSLAYAIRRLNRVGFKVRILQNKYILLTEKSWKHSRGIYLISMTEKNNDLVLSVPSPIGHPALVTSAINLFEKYNARALAISNDSGKYPKNMLKNEDNFFGRFLKMHAYNNDIITIFKNDNKSFNPVENKKTDINKTYVIYPSSLAHENSYIDYKGIFGNTKNIIDQKIFNKYNNLKNTSTIISISDAGLIHQLSNIKEYKALASNNMTKILKPFGDVFNIKKSTSKSFFSYITSIFHKTKKAKYSKSKLTKQKGSFIDKNILSKLMELSYPNSISTDSTEFLSAIKFIDFAANDINCKLTMYGSESKKPEYIVFSKDYNPKNKRIKGAYFFRVTKSEPYIVEVFNLNRSESLKIASMLINELNPSTILFAMSPILDVDLSELTDITIPTSSLFNLVNQVAMRDIDTSYDKIPEKKKKETPLTLQVRVLEETKDKKYDKTTLYISTYYGKYKYSQLSNSEKKVYNYLKMRGYKIEFAHGTSEKTAGLEANRLEQSRYIPSTKHLDFMVLWLPPNIEILKKEKNKNSKSKKDINTTKKPEKEKKLSS